MLVISNSQNSRVVIVGYPSEIHEHIQKHYPDWTVDLDKGIGNQGMVQYILTPPRKG